MCFRKNWRAQKMQKSLNIPSNGDAMKLQRHSSLALVGELCHSSSITMPRQQRCSATPAAELCYGCGNAALQGGEKEADFALNNVKEAAVMPCGVCGGHTLCFTTCF